LRRLTEAVEDAEYAVYLDGGVEAHDLLEEVRIQKRIAEAVEAKNHYLALDVPTDSSDDTIKRAYKLACMKWHPDRWSLSPDTERELAELCFKECNTAHQVLSDEESRIKYDFYLHQRQFDPSLPHPMDAPHHYQYVQHTQQMKQQKAWAAAGMQSPQHPHSPHGFPMGPTSPQWHQYAASQFPFANGYPLSPMSMGPMSPPHSPFHSPHSGLRQGYQGHPMFRV